MAPPIPIDIMFAINAPIIRITPDTKPAANPAAPPKIVPPITNRIANTIAPNAPATVAFHNPPSIPS